MAAKPRDLEDFFLAMIPCIDVFCNPVDVELSTLNSKDSGKKKNNNKKHNENNRAFSL